MSDRSSEVQATSGELARRDAVIARAIDFIRSNQRIKLQVGPAQDGVGQDFALQSVDNDFSGSLGPYRYQIDGEDDLLHLIVVRADGRSLTPEDGRSVAGFVFVGVPPAVIWLKPGVFSQHFYIGHDELLSSPPAPEPSPSPSRSGSGT